MANHLTTHTPAGYDALIAKFGLKTLPNWHHSAVKAVREIYLAK